MTGSDLRAIRKRLGLSSAAFARALGYSGPHAGSQVRKLERCAQDISPVAARCAQALDRLGARRIPPEWLSPA